MLWILILVQFSILFVVAAVYILLRAYIRTAQMESNYVAGLVTLTAANTEYNLLKLIRAQVDANCPGAARQIHLFAAHANSALIYVGAGNVTNTQYAYVLGADAERDYESTYQNILLGNLCVYSTSAGQQIGVEVMAA